MLTQLTQKLIPVCICLIGTGAVHGELIVSDFNLTASSDAGPVFLDLDSINGSDFRFEVVTQGATETATVSMVDAETHVSTVFAPNGLMVFSVGDTIGTALATGESADQFWVKEAKLYSDMQGAFPLPGDTGYVALRIQEFGSGNQFLVGHRSREAASQLAKQGFSPQQTPML